MAVLKMKNIRIAVAKKDLKKCVSFLQKAGIVEIKKTVPIDGFKKTDFLSERLSFERTVGVAENSLPVINKFFPEKKGLLSSFEGRKEIDINQYYEMVSTSTSTAKYCYDIVSLDKQLADEKSEISRLSILLDELESWKGFDLPTDYRGTRFTDCYIGSITGYYSAGEIKTLIEENGFTFPFEIEVVSANKIRTNIFAVCLMDNSELFSSTLRKLSFSGISSPDKNLIPLEKVKELEARRSGLQKDTEHIVDLIGEMAKHREEIKFFIDYYNTRIGRYELYGELEQSENVALIDGFIPEKYAVAISNAVEERFSAAVEITTPDENEEVPVALENNSFTRPCESLVSMYSMPSKTDVDPTATMAIFFYIFFGMMLSDAGYGLIIVIACAIGLLKLRLEEKTKNNLKMFLYCGISTCFWGVLFGSFFGDLIPQIAKTYFNKTIEIPKLLDPVGDALPLLIFGIGMGVFHIYFGMGVKFYNLCRQGMVKDAVFDVGFWFVTLTGAILSIVGAMGGYPNITPYGLYTLGAGALGLVLTQGRNSKGFSKIIGGLASLYDITAYASDILSYSRLMALGLATGVFAQVINQLGIGKGVGGTIKFVIIFIIGNAISFAMNALGAYVHTIRLQYVEYFGKFYDGGGREFNPFRTATEFFRFKKQ